MRADCDRCVSLIIMAPCPVLFCGRSGAGGVSWYQKDIELAANETTIFEVCCPVRSTADET